MKKQTVIETLTTLEDDFNMEQLIEKLLFVEKVEQGLKQVDEGKVTPFEDVKQRFAEKWSRR